MEFIESLNYEGSVREIRKNMISYYVENDLIWDDDSKLKQYREECDLWKIRDKEDIGFLMTHEKNGEFYLAELHIAAQYRGKGYGSMALEMASDYAARLGHEEIRIRVLKNNLAYRLYLRSGYNLEKELPYTYQLVAKTHNKERQISRASNSRSRHVIEILTGRSFSTVSAQIRISADMLQSV